VLSIGNLKNARVDRQSSTQDRFANFFGNLKKPSKQRRLSYRKFKKKSLAESFALRVDQSYESREQPALLVPVTWGLGP
jgi:hypothetical protein